MAADGAESPEQPSGTGRGRRNGALALVVVASLLAFPAILAVWVNRQLLNTDNWTETSTQLLENRLIRDQVATFLVNELYTRVDVQGELQQALPPRLQPLAGPAAGALRDLAERSTRKALARPRAQERWAQANRQAHLALLQVLEGGGSVVSTQGGKVVLDLRSLLGETASRFGVGGRIQGRLPASAAQITILESDQLDTAQKGLKLLKGLPWVLVILSLACFGGALALAPHWRRQALRAYGVGFIVAGLAALVTRSVAGDQLVGALGSTAAVRPAIAAAWQIATPLLEQAATAVIGYGVVMVLGAWLAGPSRPAVAVRRFLAPGAHSLAASYGVLAVIVALILWWGPTPATRKPLLALILIVLLALGAEALRRQIVRENPDASLHAAGERIRAVWASVVAWARTRGSEGAGAIRGTAERVRTHVSSDPAGTTIDELERLAHLRDSGVIDDAEFAAQKQRVLANGEDAEPPPAGEGATAAT
jgi:hypothetical protein